MKTFQDYFLAVLPLAVMACACAAAQAKGHHGGHHHGGHHHGHHPHFSFGLDFYSRPYPYDYYYPRYVYVPAPVYAPPTYYQYPPAAAYGAAAPVNESSQQPTVATASGRIAVQLPDPEGDVWFDGRKAAGSGSTRYFHYAPGQNEKSRTVKVTAAWHEDGRLVSRERTVAVLPGQTTDVDLSNAANDLPSSRLSDRKSSPTR